MRLRPLDLVIVALYLAGITLFGLRFRRPDRSLKSYFLADRAVPWWAIALSIVSAETSTLTIIGVPGLAYRGNLGFLQLVFGYLVARVVISLIFIPQYYKGEMFTAYQLIDRRFGALLHKMTAGLFLVTRAAAEGVRVFAVSIVVGIAIGTRDLPSIAIILLLTLVYTFEGGMAAVIWTDVVQMFIYIGGTMIGFATLLHLVPGGWNTVHAAAASAGKLNIFDFAFDLTTTYTFWAGTIGGTFLTMASHGTDQLMVQRLLAAKNERESKVALLSSGIAILMQFTLFLLVGAALWVFYAGRHFDSADRIFPTFMVEQMPSGIAGLMIAAVLAAAMSNISAALNSLSSTTVVDFYMRRRPEADDRRRMLLSRIATIGWAAVMFGVAVLAKHVVSVMEFGLSIASVAYGGLLGVFLLGLITRRANQTGAIAGMAMGLALNLTLWLAPRFGHMHTAVAYTWYVTIGACVTFVVGYLVSLITSPRPEAAPLG